MPPERAAHIAAQLASAVGAAHQEGIVHRNLSPHNVLLLDNAADGDFVKVRDFGLSKLDSDDAEDSNGQLTQVGARVGNTHYMAPEYVEEGRVHPKGDVYAVGGLLYHMLTGRPPYEGRAGDVLTAHVASPVPVPSSAQPGLPPWCDELVAKLMAKRTKDRPGAYRVPQLLEDAVGRPLGAPSLLRVAADGTVQRPPKRPPKAMAAGVLGAAMLAAAAVVVLGGMALLGGAFLYQATQMATAEPEPEGLQPLEAPVEPALPAAAPEAPPSPAPAAEGPSPAPAPAARPAPSPSPSPAPAPPPADAGSVDVRANERALVYVNGKVKGYTPQVVRLAPGEHAIAVALPGQPDTRQEKRVSVGANQQETLDFTF
jgi:serine/threonine-protein kinase